MTHGPGSKAVALSVCWQGGFVWLCLLVTAATAEGRMGQPPRGHAGLAQPLSAVRVYELPSVHAAERLAEDLAAGPGVPLRFAVPAEVSISPATHGTWEPLTDGGRLWRLRLYSPGATDLNFGFTRFRLPPGATLHVESEDWDYYEGPYGNADNEPHFQLWTPVLPGPRAVIELYVPPGAAWEPELYLAQVGLGYRDLFRLSEKPSDLLKLQGACNIDVKCPEGDPWRSEIRSVALYSVQLLGGTALCTGTLVNGTASDFRNYFLTANHCGVNSTNDATVVVYWNYESPTCGQLGGGSRSQNQSGTTFRAARTDVDFTLLELDRDPNNEYDVHYAGWDRSGTAPSGAVAIHHPSGKEKAISINTDRLTTANNPSLGSINTHWRVDNWEKGTTEPGSSGSGIWDPDSHRLVGTLTGGAASCSNRAGSDYFGKTSVAWSGPFVFYRLSDWLDPLSAGVSQIAGADPAPIIRYRSHQVTDACAGNPANQNAVLEPGESAQITVEVHSTGAFSNVRGTLSSSTPGVTILDATATWPDLTIGTNAFSQAPNFTVQLSNTIACGTTLSFTLNLTANEGGPFTSPFTATVGAPAESTVSTSIPDGGTTTSNLVIGTDVTLTDVKVQVDIQHSAVGDLIVKLRSPAGTQVTLLDRPGYPAMRYGCVDDNMNVTFDDAASLNPENHCIGSADGYGAPTWLVGVGRPAQPLSAFNGQSSLGTWVLTVTDAASLDIGRILAWRLFTTPAVSRTCAVCGATPTMCTGDCDDSGDVPVNELITMVNIALGNSAVTSCEAGDANQDGQITVDEILTAVNNALNGCPLEVST